MKKRYVHRLSFFFAIIFLVPVVAIAADATSTSFSLESVGFESAGGVGTSTSYQAEQHLPFVDGGLATSTSFMVDVGFSFTSSSVATSSDDDDDDGGGGGGGGGGSNFVGGGAILPIPSEPVQPPYFSPETALVTPPSNVSAPGAGNALETIAEAVKEFFVPNSKPFVIGKIELEKIVPKVAPLAFRSAWPLLDPGSLRELVFRPLPAELKNLAGEVPQLGKLFAEVGINRFNDLQKLKNISLKVPGLSDVLALPTTPVSGGFVGEVKDIALNELTPELREKFPKGVLFAKLASGNIDAKPQLTISESGQTEQVIRTVVGSTLSLSVRPQYAASSVQGFLLFRGKGSQPLSVESSPASSFARAFGILTATAKESFETALVVSQFSFLDPDGDGIYTAAIQTPVVSAEYEILTLINYKDQDRGTQLLRMVTVVDPEGYVYELTSSGKEVRIPGAVVTLEWRNPATQSYEVWPAKEYQQENPQVTDATGQYSFLVPPGTYKITIDAPGYSLFAGDPFEVKEGSGVHENIQLTSSFKFLKAIDWKTTALLIAFLLILYNFYRDRRRDSSSIRTSASPP